MQIRDSVGSAKFYFASTSGLIIVTLILICTTLLHIGRSVPLIVAAFLGAPALLGAYLLYRSVKMLKSSETRAIERLAHGDMKKSTGGFDDVQTSAAGPLSQLCKKITTTVFHIIADKTTLDATSDELETIAHDTLLSSEKLDLESQSLAAASEQLSTNISSMATASEELSTTARTVAASIEEMTASINEVANNSNRGAVIGQDVSRKASEAGQIISQMGEGTKQISSIVQVIQQIADQTNLLALNATIEAASAGEAGKGFAVVASEVKELARQSRTASEQITTQVEQTQENTRKAVETIKMVFNAINELATASSTIAAAVQEQSATTEELARSISNVSSATDELAHNIQEGAAASEDVAKKAIILENIARQTSLVSSQTKIGVESINDVRNDLERLMQEFSIDDGRFDISKIKTAHMVWVTRLQSVLRGELQLKPEDITIHTECDFGKWFFSESGKRLSSIPVYSDVQKYHEQVHILAREVVRVYNENQLNAAQKIMADFETARNKMFGYLNELFCYDTTAGADGSRR